MAVSMLFLLSSVARWSGVNFCAAARLAHSERRVPVSSTAHVPVGAAAVCW